MKGKPGGPGRKKIPEDIKAARKLTTFEFERVVRQFLDMPRDELEKKVTDKKAPVIESLVGMILLRGIKDGDQARLNFMLDRTIGPVKKALVLEGGDRPIETRLSKKERREVIKGLMRSLKVVNK